ncbi:MAG: MBL fold metallo-hydrolase [Pseudomonadota bacterium]
MREPIYKKRPVAPFPATFGGQRINDFILLSEGFSNVYLLETGAGSIQINAGMGIEAPVHRQNFMAFSGAPVRHLILTQGHVDHVGGVQYFRDHNPGLEVIAQAGNPEHQSYDARLAAFRANRSAFAFSDKFARAFEDYAQHGLNEFPDQDAPEPDVMFTDRHTLELGGRKLELIAVAGAETNDSLIVWLPDEGICFTGNLFGCPFGHFPNLVTIRGDRYRDALTVAAAVRTVMELKPKMILYGHHGPVVGERLIKEELNALHGAIHFVHDAVVEGMNRGADLHTLMASVALPPELEVGEGYGKVSWGVRAIWEHYAGWFKHESTTELYPQAMREVHEDIVDLAGEQAIIERARQRLQDESAVQALHLLSLLGPTDQLTGDARGLAAQAHKRLLADSDNFWLSAWLSHQLQRMETDVG